MAGEVAVGARPSRGSGVNAGRAGTLTGGEEASLAVSPPAATYSGSALRSGPERGGGGVRGRTKNEPAVEEKVLQVG